VLMDGGPNDGKAEHLTECIVKYGLDGKLLWQKFFAAADAQAFHFLPSAVIVLQSGDILAIQSFATANHGLVLYRFDSQGNYLSGKQFSGDGLMTCSLSSTSAPTFARTNQATCSS